MKVPMWIFTTAIAAVLGGIFIAYIFFSNNNYKLTGALSDKKIGKQVTIVVTENRKVDASYISKQINGESTTNTPDFDLLDKEECKKLISYMEENKLSIVPGRYETNQGWTFKEIKDALVFSN